MDNYVGEIRIFGGTFAPAGWLDCSGQLLNVSDYEALYTLIGTTYGGNGQTNFALPNLQSRAVVGMGMGNSLSNYSQGQMAGQENVTLNTTQLPTHQHPLQGNVQASTGAAGQTSPKSAYFGDKGGELYSNGASNSTLAPDALTATLQPAGGNGPHVNIQPYLTIRYIIATQGVFPTQN